MKQPPWTIRRAHNRASSEPSFTLPDSTLKMFHVEHCGTFCFTLPTTSPYAGVPLRVWRIRYYTRPARECSTATFLAARDMSRAVFPKGSREVFQRKTDRGTAAARPPPGNFGASRGGGLPRARRQIRDAERGRSPPNVSTGQALLAERSFHVKQSWRPETCREVSNEEVKTKCSTWNTLRRDPLRQPPEIKSKSLGSVRNFSFPPGAPA